VSSFIKQKFDYLVKKSSEYKNNAILLAKQCLAAKKIVIISDKGISSVPMSFRFQATIASIAVTSLLWVSYSTGKYFAYEEIISEKDREIWSTNVTNENLQYQVSDLHQNLTDLNKYFENIKKFDQLADKNKDEMEVSSSDKTEKEVKQSKDVKDIISNIQDKVSERISSLESVIEMTGLKLDEIAAANVELKTAIDIASQSNQGGPYVPENLDHTNFQMEMKYLMQLEKTIHSFPLTAPMQRYWISSGYGKRVDPIHKTIASHYGVDFVGKFRSKVLSSAPGTIIKAGRYGAYGNYVEIDHGSKITTRYGHLHKVLVRKGDKVERGQVVGLQGNSGRSTGTHLHYEVRYDNKPYNPKNFLKAGKYVF